jgi:beta-N-acetylhexosaminidase
LANYNHIYTGTTEQCSGYTNLPLAFGKPVKSLKKLTIEQKIGQLLSVPHFAQDSPFAPATDISLMQEMLERYHIGGIGVFGGSYCELSRQLKKLQSTQTIPVLVAADLERGLGHQVDGGTAFPAAMALGAADSPDLAYAQGQITAQEALAVGIQQVYAPVVDLNRHPDNPIINIRSFGESLQRVQHLTAAFIRGVQEAGALATVKHFPDHGNVNIDSHLSLPIVKWGTRREASAYLAPYRRAVEEGVASVMVGHIGCPFLDPDGLPASLSKSIVTRCLREQIGFEGLVVSDALIMGAIARRFTVYDAVVRAVNAGVDVLLMPPDIDLAYKALIQALEIGEIQETTIDLAVDRVLVAKERAGLFRNKLAIDKAVDGELLPGRIAQTSLTLIEENTKQLPLSVGQDTCVTLVTVRRNSIGTDALIRQCQKYAPNLQHIDVRTVEDWPQHLQGSVIIALYTGVVAGGTGLQLPDGMSNKLNGFLCREKDTVVVTFGSPYVAAELPDARTVIHAWSSVAVSQKAAADAIFKTGKFPGRMPVTIPALPVKVAVPKPMPAHQQFDESLPGQLQKLTEDAVAKQVTPGGVAWIGGNGNPAISLAFGNHTYQANAAAVTTDTIYDLASLTKVIATAACCMVLRDRDLFDPDMIVKRVVPEYRGLRKNTTSFRQLLQHRSGLQDYIPLFEKCKTSDDMLEIIRKSRLVEKPDTITIYSDLGYIVLGEALQRITQKPLDQLFSELVAKPLGMSSTSYLPPKTWKKRIAPTELDVWRDRLLHGEVHDENAAVCNGVAGHAGLFGTAADLARFAECLLNRGMADNRQVFSRAVIDEFLQPDTVLTGKVWTMGWSSADSFESTGEYFSPGARGHLGYTGTSLWIDFQRSLYVILLTNRVHPSRSNTGIHEFRRSFHNMVFEAYRGPAW